MSRRIRHVIHTPVDRPETILKDLVREKIVKAVEIDGVVIYGRWETNKTYLKRILK